MSAGLPKVNVAVQDRVLLHLVEHVEQFDRYVVGPELTRPGIAEACAQHPPNVSRTMRALLRDEMVTEHTRTVRGEDRRQKTWQLTDKGKSSSEDLTKTLGSIKVLLRDSNGELLEVEASEAPERLSADISLLQVLMHAQHEGVLTFGDIRFGAISKRSEESHPKPGRLTPMTGAHATYHNKPPVTRPVHGRTQELQELHDWFDARKPCAVVHGIAGIGKSINVGSEFVSHIAIVGIPSLRASEMAICSLTVSITNNAAGTEESNGVKGGGIYSDRTSQAINASMLNCTISNNIVNGIISC